VVDVVNQESGKLLGGEKKLGSGKLQREVNMTGMESRQGFLICVSGQDPSGGEKTGGNSQSQIF
jgi:hypothetical protein